MPRIKFIDIDPADVDADGLAQSQTPAAGGAQSLTLNGALISGGTFTDSSGHGRQLLLTTAADETSRTFTVTGTDPDGYAITEEIAGVNNTTAESTNYFLTVSSITVDDDTAGAITFGTVDELATKTIMLNRHMDTGPLVQLEVTGTISITAQITASRIRDIYAGQGSLIWTNTSTAALVTASTDLSSYIEPGAYACRFLVNSYTNTAEAQINISEESG